MIVPTYKDKNNGKWYVKYSTKDPVTGKRVQTLKRGFSRQSEAKKWEAEQLASKATSTSVSFEEMMAAYLDYSNASETSRYLKTTFVTRHFPLRTEPINKITKEMLVNWRNTLRTSGLANRTANRGMSYIKSVFSFATEIYGIPNVGNVLKSFKLSKEDKKEMSTWDVDEFNRFIECVHGEYYRGYFVFLFWSGCRRSEGLAVCKDDFDGRTVHIWRSIKHFSNGFLPLKTDSSERYITLDSKTYETLKPLIEKGSPFVFGGQRSLPITCVQREFERAIKESGVKRIRIHDLRHSHASFLLGNNVPPVAVKDRLGHSSLSQTLSTYAHLMREPHDKMIATIDALREKERL